MDDNVGQYLGFENALWDEDKGRKKRRKMILNDEKMKNRCLRPSSTVYPGGLV